MCLCLWNDWHVFVEKGLSMTYTDELVVCTSWQRMSTNVRSQFKIVVNCCIAFSSCCLNLTYKELTILLNRVIWTVDFVWHLASSIIPRYINPLCCVMKTRFCQSNCPRYVCSVTEESTVVADDGHHVFMFNLLRQKPRT